MERHYYTLYPEQSSFLSQKTISGRVSFFNKVAGYVDFEAFKSNCFEEHLHKDASATNPGAIITSL